jgi:hypothetical protein
MRISQPAAISVQVPFAQVLDSLSTTTDFDERRCAAGTPLRRSRKELSCKQVP